MTPSTTSLPPGRAWLDIHLANLVANARTVQRAAGGTPLLPMVKADAYGLGAVPVAEALESLAPWGYGVATVPEGAALRAAGIDRPIVVFTPALAGSLDAYRAHGLHAVLDDPATAAAWEAPFHLELDTGMGRCGVRWDDADAIARVDLPALEGVFTHFHSADTDPGSVLVQWERFARAVAPLRNRKRLIHAASSSGAWRLQERLDLVRPGIFLYGGRLAADLPDPQPVATLRAPVVSVRRLQPGDGVSYGHDWRADRESTIVTLGVGYADGVLRSVQDRAEVLIGGRRYPVVGRVTMDFIMVDVGDEPVRAGTLATLIGADGAEEITVDEFAAWAGTISYEVLTGFVGRLERRYPAP